MAKCCIHISSHKLKGVIGTYSKQIFYHLLLYVIAEPPLHLDPMRPFRRGSERWCAALLRVTGLCSMVLLKIIFQVLNWPDFLHIFRGPNNGLRAQRS